MAYLSDYQEELVVVGVAILLMCLQSMVVRVVWLAWLTIELVFYYSATIENPK